MPLTFLFGGIFNHLRLMVFNNLRLPDNLYIEKVKVFNISALVIVYLKSFKHYIGKIQSKRYQSV